MEDKTRTAGENELMIDIVDSSLKIHDALGELGKVVERRSVLTSAEGFTMDWSIWGE